MEQLSGLTNVSVRVLDDDTYPEQGQASVVLLFANGTRLRTTHWRVIVNGRAELSSFDHKQKYGLPRPIDAKTELREILANAVCSNARLDGETGDLIFVFGDHLKFQAFNFTGYEIWEIKFPGGTGQYSNYAVAPD